MAVQHIAGFSKLPANAVFFSDSNGDLCLDTGFAYDPNTQRLTAPMRLSGVSAALTASTTQTQAGGTPLTAEVNQVGTSANTNDAVTMPVAVVGMRVTVINNGANTIKVFPAAGANFDGGSGDAAVTQATTVNKTYVAITTLQWETL
jgi:hypothetical protein